MIVGSKCWSDQKGEARVTTTENVLFFPFFIFFYFYQCFRELGEYPNWPFPSFQILCRVCFYPFFSSFFCCHPKYYKFFATRFRWERIPCIGLVYHKHTLFDSKAFATKAWKGSECNRGSLKTRMYYIVVSPNKKWILFGMITVWRLLQIRRIWYGLFRYNSSTVTYVP